MSRSALAALVAILVASSGTPAPRLKQKAPSVPYWSMKVGATLTYESAGSEQTVAVTAVERVGDVTRVSSSETTDGKTFPGMTVEIRPDGLFLVEQGGQPCEVPLQLLRFPVKAGEKWETVCVWGGKATRFVREAGEAKVLETPAGRFEAVPITSDLPDLKLPRSVIWYAPELGIVKVDGDRVLTAYTPGK
jgi:hypothetical protein